MVFLSRCSGSLQAFLPRRVSARGTPISIGVVLLTAAALKTHQLTTGASQEDGIFTSRWLLIGLVELELALGLWLLAGAYPGQARLMALATFAGFSLVSLYQALTGVPSCGCFGKISVKPWHTLLFDLVAAVMLWWWKPGIYKRMFISRGGGGAAASEHLFTFFPSDGTWTSLRACGRSRGDCHESPSSGALAIFPFSA